MNASGPSNVWCPSVSILKKAVHHVGEFQIVIVRWGHLFTPRVDPKNDGLEPQSIPGEVKVRRATESF